jgi:hypothetical protein
MKTILILLVSLCLPAAGRPAGRLSQADLLRGVVIPHLEVIDSPAADFYGFLAEMGREHVSTSDVHQAAINIIVALPPAAANRSITFKANNASLLRVLLDSTRQHGLTCELADGYALIGPGPQRSPGRRAEGTPAAAPLSPATKAPGSSRVDTHGADRMQRIGEARARGIISMGEQAPGIRKSLQGGLSPSLKQYNAERKQGAAILEDARSREQREHHERQVLSKIVLRDLRFRDAPLSQVLDAIEQSVDESLAAAGVKSGVDRIRVKASPETLAARITFSSQSISLYDALRAVTSPVGLSFQISRGTIVVTEK